MEEKEKLPFNSCMRKELKRKYYVWFIRACTGICLLAGIAAILFLIENIISLFQQYAPGPLFSASGFILDLLFRATAVLTSVNPLIYIGLAILSIPFWDALYDCLKRQLDENQRENIKNGVCVVMVFSILPIIGACYFNAVDTAGHTMIPGAALIGALIGIAFDLLALIFVIGVGL